MPAVHDGTDGLLLLSHKDVPLYVNNASSSTPPVTVTLAFELYGLINVLLAMKLYGGLHPKYGYIQPFC